MEWSVHVEKKGPGDTMGKYFWRETIFVGVKDYADPYEIGFMVEIISKKFNLVISSSVWKSLFSIGNWKTINSF
jgi:hypothetical protein